MSQRHPHLSLSAVARPEPMAFTLSLLAAIFWGASFEATRIVLHDVTPWTAAAMRFAIASVVILIWLGLRQGYDLGALRRNALAFAVLGVIGIFGFNAALFLGMQSSSPVTAALIMATSPLTTNLAEALIQRRAPTRIAIIGMVIGLTGVALTVGAFSGASFSGGDLLILGGSLAWVAYTIGCRRWVVDATPLAGAAWTMLAGALALIAAALLMEAPATVLSHASANAWMAILWMAVPGSVLAYLFWQVGIAVRGPGATSVLFNLVPVAALIVAMAFGRMPGATQILGIAIAIFGVMLSSGRLRIGRIGG
ncbi:MAG: DMT family transporter [Paracoccus sp. (in: a-proteobacteria)]|nr:DMT family transporter [Paracoccus sp. (in: a-proteobacteria)]